MTIVQAITQKLEGSGLEPDEAAKVVEALQSSEGMESMAGEWNKSTEECSVPLLAVLVVAAKCIAIEHLEATKLTAFRTLWLKNLTAPRGGF